MSNENTHRDLTVDQIEAGTQIPDFVIPLTVQRLVMEAGANRDFAPIHHDREIARATGAEDMYANTLFLQGLIEVTLRNWMGLAGKLKKINMTMTAFNYAGDELVCGGKIVSKSDQDGQSIIELDIRVDNQRERSVTGKAWVQI